MGDYLGNLIARSFNPTTSLQPRLGSTYEPLPIALELDFRRDFGRNLMDGDATSVWLEHDPPAADDLAMVGVGQPEKTVSDKKHFAVTPQRGPKPISELLAAPLMAEAPSLTASAPATDQVALSTPPLGDMRSQPDHRLKEVASARLSMSEQVERHDITIDDPAPLVEELGKPALGSGVLPGQRASATKMPIQPADTVLDLDHAPQRLPVDDVARPAIKPVNLRTPPQRAAAEADQVRVAEVRTPVVETQRDPAPQRLPVDDVPRPAIKPVNRRTLPQPAASEADQVRVAALAARAAINTAAELHQPRPAALPTALTLISAVDSKTQTMFPDIQTGRRDLVPVEAVPPSSRTSLDESNLGVTTPTAVVRPHVIPHIAPATPPSGPLEAASTPPPTIHVTIGRVEVRAVPAPGPASSKRRNSGPPVMSLDDYLHRRNEESGR